MKAFLIRRPSPLLLPQVHHLTLSCCCRHPFSWTDEETGRGRKVVVLLDLNLLLPLISDFLHTHISGSLSLCVSSREWSFDCTFPFSFDSYLCLLWLAHILPLPPLLFLPPSRSPNPQFFCQRDFAADASRSGICLLTQSEFCRRGGDVIYGLCSPASRKRIHSSRSLSAHHQSSGHPRALSLILLLLFHSPFRISDDQPDMD
jgi:hypothetical protein